MGTRQDGPAVSLVTGVVATGAAIVLGFPALALWIAPIWAAGAVIAIRQPGPNACLVGIGGLAIDAGTLVVAAFEIGAAGYAVWLAQALQEHPMSQR